MNENTYGLNIYKLREVMDKNNDNGKTIAKFLNKTPATISRKMNHVDGSDFTRIEIRMLIKKWKLSYATAMQVFFGL